MKPYYEDEWVTLYHGRAEDVLPDLESIDHVITDPPYSERVHSAVRSGRMASENDRGGRYGADTRRNVDLGFSCLTPELRSICAQQFSRLAKRWVLVFSDVESDHLWREELVAAGLDYVRTGAWVKLGATPQFSGDRPATGFEAITICHPKGRKRWNGGGRHGLWQVPIMLDRAGTGARVHTTQKPLALMDSLILDFTDRGDTILDCFSGSGTTLIAAKRHGRKAIGVEEDAHYCAVIADRVTRLEVGDAPLEQGVFDFGEVS